MADPLPGYTPDAQPAVLKDPLPGYQPDIATTSETSSPPPPPKGMWETAIQPSPSSAIADWVHRNVDLSITPGPNVGDVLPFSTDPKAGVRLALPNPVRALLTEGPQIQSNPNAPGTNLGGTLPFRVVAPGATYNPETGTYGVTPEAAAAAALVGPSPLRGAAPPGVRLFPPWDPNTEMHAVPPPAADIPTVTVRPPAGPIMTEAEIQARARGFFSPADRAVVANAMLPDTNAAASRKIFSDFVPDDSERARITAGQPAMQAARNVDPTGPMSYATAMDIDRDLTSRMRGASGSDAHDLSELQQALRTQMDQVPDLDSLRPGRQAWMQSIKQGQMEDINYGASLKNDPAAADAYVRQRAAALLKNDNAMRYWNDAEKGELQQVAQSGDIGMLGRLSVSLIKPIIRATGAGIGGYVGGVPGAIVGGEIGGDVGTTQAARLRAYLSKTTLDPVMQQITAGVPTARPPSLLNVPPAPTASAPPGLLNVPPPGTAPPQGTGLAGIGTGMASAISGNLSDMLWKKFQAGDLTELGQPSQLLQAADAMRGQIKTQADFDRVTQAYAAAMRAARAARTAQGPEA